MTAKLSAAQVNNNIITSSQRQSHKHPVANSSKVTSMPIKYNTNVLDNLSEGEPMKGRGELLSHDRRL